MHVNTSTSALTSSLNYDLYDEQDDKSSVNKSATILRSTTLEMVEEFENDMSKINSLLGQLNQPHSKLIQPLVVQEVFETLTPWAEQTLNLCKELTDRGIIGKNCEWDLSLNGDDSIDLTIRLLSLNTMQQTIDSKKEGLVTKTNEREGLAVKNNVEQTEATKKQSEIDFEKNQKANRSHLKGILGKIFKCLTALAGVAVAIVTAAVTGGASTPLVVGAVLACISAVATLTQLGLEIAAENTNDPKMQKRLQIAGFAVGGFAALVGIAGSVTSIVGIAKLGGAIRSTAVLVSEIISGTISGSSMIVDGAFQVELGARERKIADSEKMLSDRKIRLEELSADIEFLEQLIKSLQANLRDMLKMFCEVEEDMANAIKSQGDSQQNIAAQMS